MKIIKVKRTIVAEILDRVRQDLAARVPHEEIERRLAGATEKRGYSDEGAYRIHGAPSIPPLVECVHEGGAFTDNCLACAPRWRWAGPKVVCT